MTPEQVKADFNNRGIPVSQWAEEHGFRPNDVYRVLGGVSPCKRGNVHRIAVALGLKEYFSTTRA